MPDEILTIDDYTELMTKKMRSLRHFERCLFSAWCSQHLLDANAKWLEAEISVSKLTILQQVLDQIWDRLLEGTIPETELLHKIDAKYMEIEMDLFDENDPILSGVINAVGICILGCRRNDTRLSQLLGERVIEVLEDQYSVEEVNIFQHPALKEEMEIQLKMVRQLTGKYELDESLRRMFRN